MERECHNSRTWRHSHHLLARTTCSADPTGSIVPSAVDGGEIKKLFTRGGGWIAGEFGDLSERASLAFGGSDAKERRPPRPSSSL
eukprot:5007149-Pleurochrysis_carterae.AAC.2